MSNGESNASDPLAGKTALEEAKGASKAIYAAWKEAKEAARVAWEEAARVAWEKWKKEWEEGRDGFGEKS